MTSSYRALASEVGCLSAEIYKEIRRCLRLRGGVTHDGIKWIWKTSEELAERLGCHEKTVRRHLKALVEMGWLKREQLQKRWGMRAYHYCLGDNAPLKPVAVAGSDQKNTQKEPLAQNPLLNRRFDRTEPDKMSASINRNTTFRNTPTGQNSPNSQGATRQTEQLSQGEIAKNATISDRRSLYAAVPLVPETNVTTPRTPDHWPQEQMSRSLKVQVIEAARQMAFPGRKSRGYGFAC